MCFQCCCFDRTSDIPSMVTADQSFVHQHLIEMRSLETQFSAAYNAFLRKLENNLIHIEQKNVFIADTLVLKVEHSILHRIELNLRNCLWKMYLKIVRYHSMRGFLWHTE